MDCKDSWHTHTTIRKEQTGWHWVQIHHDFERGWFSHYYDGYEETWGLALASANLNAVDHKLS